MFDRFMPSLIEGELRFERSIKIGRLKIIGISKFICTL